MDRNDLVLNFINDAKYKPMKFNDIAAILGVPESERMEFGKTLDGLVIDGKVFKEKDGKYVSLAKSGYVSGTYSSSGKGFGFLRPDDRELKDVYISSDKSMFAVNGDKVLVKITKKGTTLSDEGVVTEILKRENETIVGTVQTNKKVIFVIPDDTHLGFDVYITSSGSKKYKDNMKVVVKITKWPDDKKGAAGRITEILGYVGERGIDVMSVIKSRHIRSNFGGFCLNEADKVSKADKNIKHRTDYRNKLTITIDGEDAKDLDDAISLEKVDDIYRLGVHIADVSDYVKEGSVIDKEAFKRGTSIYFADRVIPMLPEVISNGCCSLNPDGDRLALSVIMDIDNKGNVVKYNISESVIRSDFRMTYTNVTKIIDNDNEMCEKYSDIVPMIAQMKELALILNDKRVKRGSVNFEIPEAKIIFDKNGKVLDIGLREFTIANSIIEEFMLVCNETVAEHMFWGNIPCVYRVHEAPNEQKIDAFVQMLKPLGYTLMHTKEIHPSMFCKLLEQINGKPEERALSTMMLRTFMKAHYSENNDGHFGLASKYYCHFTSPIRRYPDLVVHRILKESLKGQISEKRTASLNEFVQKASVNSSEKEVDAMEAEREIEYIKKAEYMSHHIGEVYEGVVSSVTNFGIFAELPNTVEGLIRYHDIKEDYFNFDAVNMRAIGERSNKTYQIGDSVRVKISDAKPETGEIDMALIKKGNY